MQPSQDKASGDQQTATWGGELTYCESCSGQALTHTLHTQFKHDSPSHHVIHCTPDKETDMQRSEITF